MRSAIAEYLDTYTPFELFGVSHWASILLFLFLVFWLPWFAKNHLKQSSQHQVGIFLGILVGINYPLWVILEWIGGSFDVSLHLPVHLCRLANLLLPLVMIKRNFPIFEILYFWGLSGVFQGMITPDIAQDFPHFHYFRFFVGHNLMVVALIYAVVVYEMKPTLASLKKAFIALNAFLLLAFVTNLSLDSNYFWIMGKPPTASLLDYLGPWPWYILSAEFVALAHFGFAYFIYTMIEKYSIKNAVKP